MKNIQNKEKIARVSKIIRSFLFAGLVLEIVAILAFLAAFLIPLFALPKQNQHASMTFTTSGLSLLMLLAFVVTLKLFQFFDRLKNGHLFDAQTVANLDAAGKLWIGLWLYQGVFYHLGSEYFQLRMAWDSGGLFAGLILIFVAWLLKEAQELQEDQELTV